MITKAAMGIRVDEITSSVCRISTPVTLVRGGFSNSRHLVLDLAGELA